MQGTRQSQPLHQLHDDRCAAHLAPRQTVLSKESQYPASVAFFVSDVALDYRLEFAACSARNQKFVSAFRHRYSNYEPTAVLHVLFSMLQILLRRSLAPNGL